jgi:hypothetical protein
LSRDGLFSAARAGAQFGRPRGSFEIRAAKLGAAKGHALAVDGGAVTGGRLFRPTLGACMVKLKANFESDSIAHLRGRLTQEGWKADEVSRLDDRDVRNYFFESLRRKLAPQARTLKIADDFQCPVREDAGWKALRDKVQKGEDLNPHLSKGHASLFNNDGLLAEWGVHHFHLGTEPDRDNPYYVERTNISGRCLHWSTATHFARSMFIRTVATKDTMKNLASLRVFTEIGQI